MRVLLGLALAAAVLAGGVHAVTRSVQTPTVAGTYDAYTTGAAARVDWSDRTSIAFDE